jgi:hypothetical protein
VKWPRLTAAAYNDLAEAAVYFAGKGRDASLAFVTDFESDGADSTIASTVRSLGNGRFESRDTPRLTSAIWLSDHLRSYKRDA